MPDRRPDFKNMTPDDIRRGISDLNRDIRDLRKQMNVTTGKFLLGQTAALGAAVPAAIVFPPLAAGILAAGMIHGVEKSAETSVMRARLAEAESLRQQFKTVWRARPGRPFRDIDARVRRENARQAEKERKKIMRQYGKRFGFE